MKDFLKILGVVAVGILCAVGLDQCQHPRGSSVGLEHLKTVCDTVVVFDTVRYYQPVASREVSLGPQVRFLPVFVPRDSVSGECDSLPAASLSGHSTENRKGELNGDATEVAQAGLAAVSVPMTQREYEGAEYRAWVSGFEPRLDSIQVFCRSETVTVREVAKRKRWGVGVSAGYGLTPHGPEPFVGVSLNYNLFSF